MKKISRKEFYKMAQANSKAQHPVTIRMLKMQVGTALFIPFTEWTLKSSPIQAARSYSPFKVSQSRQKTGWAILRLK